MLLHLGQGFAESYPDKPNFSPVNQFPMSSLAPTPILAKLSYSWKDIIEQFEPFWYIMHKRMWSLPTAKHTLSCSNSNFCSKTIISDFPCCAERKLKNRLHLTRTSENWSCPKNNNKTKSLVIAFEMLHADTHCESVKCDSATVRHTHKRQPSLHVTISFPHYFLAMPNSESHIRIS